jgi:hypothetical protein
LRWCVKVGATVLDFGIADEEVVDIQLIEHEDYNGDDPASCISIRVTLESHADECLQRRKGPQVADAGNRR